MLTLLQLHDNPKTFLNQAASKIYKGTLAKPVKNITFKA